MAKISAGILLYRKTADGPEVFLVHPGKPFWAKKDDGSWSIPKGEGKEGEDLFETAEREFKEETGFAVPAPNRNDPTFERFVPLGSAELKGGKTVHTLAVCGNCNPTKLVSNTFSVEWPPHSGKQQSFPEVEPRRFFPHDHRPAENPSRTDSLPRPAGGVLDTSVEPVIQSHWQQSVPYPHRR